MAVGDRSLAQQDLGFGKLIHSLFMQALELALMTLLAVFCPRTPLLAAFQPCLDLTSWPIISAASHLTYLQTTSVVGKANRKHADFPEDSAHAI